MWSGRSSFGERQAYQINCGTFLRIVSQRSFAHFTTPIVSTAFDLDRDLVFLKCFVSDHANFLMIFDLG
jgi:hypothetical protein